MDYAGKRKLFDFLKSKGYSVPIMKRMEYSCHRGVEWLKYFELELFSPARGVIYVTVHDENEAGEKVRVEYSKYVDDVLDYQIKNGKQTVMFGKKYCA